jgi:hypothetical protein
MKFIQLRRLTIVLAALLAILALSSVAFGQCAMCRTALAGSNNALFVRNFNIGVLVLLVPPVAIFCSIFIALKRHKESGVESLESGVEDRESGVGNPESGVGRHQ